MHRNLSKLSGGGVGVGVGLNFYKTDPGAGTRRLHSGPVECEGGRRHSDDARVETQT